MSAAVKSIKSVATTPSKPCTQLMDIPVAVLTIMLQHVPLQQRLGVCTCVCRSFMAAAVAATNTISMPTSTQAQCDGVREWLQRHGGVTALKAQRRRGCVPCLASLPCPLLKHLRLYGFSVQPGCFAVCTRLTHLSLDLCIMERSPNASSSADSNPLAQLSVLTSLQHLSLGTIMLSQCSANKLEGTALDLPSNLLSHLVHLTYLQLGSSLLQSDAALQHLHAVTALQHVNLHLFGGKERRPTAAALTGLQHLEHLTALELCRVPCTACQQPPH